MVYKLAIAFSTLKANDVLDLASKLEYDMQPLMRKTENAVAIVRQVVVDFMNMDMNDKFPIEWKTNDKLTSCMIDTDKDLLKRAIANLIQNSMNHNENGCSIFVSVTTNNNVCDTNTIQQRHGLGLLIVKQIMDGHPLERKQMAVNVLRTLFSYFENTEC